MNWLVTCLLTPALAWLQEDRLAGIPVMQEELVAETKDPPSKHEEREQAFIALFKQAGATDADVSIVPLGESVAPHLEKAKESVAARLKQEGATQVAIDSALAALSRRHQELGRNVVVVLPGRTDRILGFAAHLDAAEGSAGVIDNWASCVLLSNLYQTLHSTRPQHTIWFIGFAEEELGCLGSAAWVDGLDREDLARIDAFVTLDCAGVAAPMLWWGGSTAGAAEMAVEAATQAGLPLQAVDFSGTRSDSLSIKSRSIPVASLLGIDPPHLRWLHGPEDRFENLDATRIQETYTLLRAIVAEFDAHAQPLLWDYVKAKLRINEPASGRKPTRPLKLDLAAVPLPATPEAPAPAATTPPRDGSRP